MSGGAHVANRSVLANSAVMAAGTVVSRASGFIRSALLAAAIGSKGLHADAFNIANTIPNMLYILLAGGVFNAVLVPQLVRTMRNDPDGGEAYTNRIMTLAGTFLLAATLLLVVGAPAVMHTYLSGDWFSPHRAAYLASAIAFARWCLPQVFFYGMFVLVGQILNARGRFGPMMWAPIGNNVISVVVLVAYLKLYGPGSTGGFSTAEQVLLGLGSTLGIAVQFLLLMPSLRAAGFRYTPRWDWRGTGLGHTLRLGVWTVLFVVANQVAYTVVVRLASSGAAHGGAGYTLYANSFLITQVPHSIITVSLATAILPRLSASAAAGDLSGLAHTLTSAVRSALSIVVPFAALLAVLATDVAQVIFGFGASHDQFHLYTPVLIAFAPGMVVFTIHFMSLRGFYALEGNRTVFWNQCAVAAVNIVAALALVHLVTAAHTVVALTAAYGLSYLVGAILSVTMLRRLAGGLELGRMLRFGVRLLIVTAAATAAAWVFHAALLTYDDSPSWIVNLIEVVAVSIVNLCVLLLCAQALHLSELTSMVDQVARRLRLR